MDINGTADEMARAAILLIENEYMNGEFVRVDGGIRLSANSAGRVDGS